MFLFGGFEIIFVAVVGLLLLGVATAVSRGEPDRTGARAQAIYLTGITFVSLFLVLASGYQVVREVAALGIADQAVEAQGFGSGFDGFSSQTCSVDSEGNEECFSEPEGAGVLRYVNMFGGNDAHIREAVRSGLVGLAALGLIFLHRKRLRELFMTDLSPTSPAGRVRMTYTYVVAFVAALVTLGALTASSYALFRIAAPGITALGDPDFERKLGIVALLSSGVLTVLAAWIFTVHRRKADEFRSFATEDEAGPV